MKKVFQNLSENARKKLKKKSMPEWTQPMLATLTHEIFSKKGWIFERKFDGERCLLFKNGSSVRILSRNKKNLNDTYPELVMAGKKLSGQSFIADGEIVAFKGSVTSFSRLQPRMQIKDPKKAKQSKIRVYLYLFDLIYFDGYDLAALPLRVRKKLLKRGLSFSDPIRLTSHRNREGKKYFKEACKKGWEGLIAKDGAGEYEHSRSKKWLKFKCEHGQEFVIGGYTDPEGSRIGFGSLLLGYYSGKKLKYAGRVGTGFDDALLKNLKKKLERRQRKSSPFSNFNKSGKNTHWVSPALVGEVSFTEWTGGGKLRHPRFKGLRRDKNPKKVIREK